MRRSIANAVVCLLALSVAVPESYARRLGGGRSVGRQAPAYRQRSEPAYQPRQATPTPPPAYVPRSTPDLARQSAPVRPNYARQGGSTPWGGMLGGALVGLGLGSLLSSHDRTTNTAANNDVNNNGTSNAARTNGADGTIDPNAPNQMSGADANGTTASGAGQAAQPAAASQIGTGSFWLWGLIALVAFMLFRRARARSAARGR